MAFTFLKTGAASDALAKKAAEEAEVRKSQQGRLFRFWIPEKEEARITFIDGDISAETGNLRPPRYWEHNLLRNGSWNNFYVCPEKTDPAAGVKCPLCADNKMPALVALFTIIDHRQHMSKDKTKVYKDTKRLLVAKPQTFELLNKHAIKRGGLSGCTFDASRVGDKAAAVGSMFDFVEKNTIADLKKLYTREIVDPKTNKKTTVTNFTPADYDKEINALSIEELQKLVVGTAGDDVPFNAKPGSGTGGSPDYSDQL